MYELETYGEIQDRDTMPSGLRRRSIFHTLETGTRPRHLTFKTEMKQRHSNKTSRDHLGTETLTETTSLLFLMPIQHQRHQMYVIATVIQFLQHVTLLAVLSAVLATGKASLSACLAL